jgi:4-diphosphocytidyl-2-C-methyl-D-erythritol kinase
MDSIIVTAPAKINLFLEVHGRKEDGYHNIESIMQTVSLCDTLIAERTDSGITLNCTELKLPRDSDNLIIKAANAFFEKTGITGGAAFKLTKLIPVAAGLGGGSTNAAAVLFALNNLYETGLTTEQLSDIGFGIGADVPFCLRRGTCYVSGVGEKLEICPGIPDCFIVIAIGKGRISTRWAFHRIDDITDRRIADIGSMRSAINKHSIEEISACLYNVFERVSPHETNIKSVMKEKGTLGTAMSGSGPAVFGIFDESGKAEAAHEALNAAGYISFVCRPVK